MWALLLAITDALTARFGGVTVSGELAGFTRASSGHCYFSLKDAQGAPALVRCAMFRRAAGLLDFAPADGQRAELRGRHTVHEPVCFRTFTRDCIRRSVYWSYYNDLTIHAYRHTFAPPVNTVQME